MDDYMEYGESGVVNLKDGWYYDKDLNIKFRYDEEGNAVDSQGEMLLPFRGQESRD
jgi:hypothetical protein